MVSYTMEYFQQVYRRGMLYIVSTPIGNLEDITLRAIKILLSVDIILCEDTRHTGFLLDQLKTKYSHLFETPSSRQKRIAFHEFSETRELGNVLTHLKTGKSVALVSDAGTPLLSDPGYPLVRECLKRNIPVIPIPGPSSILTALVGSGLPPIPFHFLGYPPEKQGKRIVLFRRLHLRGDVRSTPLETIIFLASPHKVIQILEDLLSVCGNIPIVVARELTKIHEEFIRKKVSEVIEQFKKEKPKGELVVLFHF